MTTPQGPLTTPQGPLDAMNRQDEVRLRSLRIITSLFGAYDVMRQYLWQAVSDDEVDPVPIYWASDITKLDLPPVATPIFIFALYIRLSAVETARAMGYISGRRNSTDRPIPFSMASYSAHLDFKCLSRYNTSTRLLAAKRLRSSIDSHIFELIYVSDSPLPEHLETGMLDHVKIYDTVQSNNGRAIIPVKAARAFTELT